MARGFGPWLMACVAVGWGCQSGRPEALTPSGPGRARAAAGISNILRADYVGSEACAGCHAEVYEAWKRAPMHRMTRDLALTEIMAPFDGRSLRLGDDIATLEQHDGRKFVGVSQAGARSLFRVTKVVGGRYREDFVGEQVALTEPLGAALDEQRVLPLSFLRFDGTLRYKGYSVMVPERRGLEAGVVWQRACILCHNTAPQLVALYDELFGARAPSYQGSASNELPEDKTFTYVIDDPQALRAALEAELHQLGARGALPDDSQHALEIAISNTRERFTEQALIELGVGCESCHGGARAHAEAPQQVSASFALRSPFMHIETAAGIRPKPAQDINRGCAKCHTVLFSRYPFTWEGGERSAEPGGSTTNSGEARDFLLGSCARALSCTACHDPHGQDSRSLLDDLGTVAGNRVCTPCHQALAAPSALQRHSHHSPGGEGGACLNCHMPRKNMGLAYEFTRYHRIGSPTDPERVLGDRPLECALCHADRSVDQIVSTMEKWWGKRYERAKLQQLYGADLRENPLRVTLLGGKPHEKALAADIAVRRDVPDTTDSIVALLNNQYPLVRYFAHHSLERRFGTPIPLDMNQNGPELIKSARRWLAEHDGRNGGPQSLAPGP